METTWIYLKIKNSRIIHIDKIFREILQDPYPLGATSAITLLIENS